MSSTTADFIPRKPDFTHRRADTFFILLAAVAAFTLCLVLCVPSENPVERTPAFFGGSLLGLLLPRIFPHRYRVLGFAPYALLAATLITLLAGSPTGWCWVLVCVQCICQGIAVGTVLRYRDRFRIEFRRFLVSALVGVSVGIAILAAFLTAGPKEPFVQEIYYWILVTLLVLTTLFAAVAFKRPAISLFFEMFIDVMYRVRATGPGEKVFPLSGPLLVIANHAAWLDPLLLEKVIPRPTTPMMTASFYNFWLLRPLMRYVVKVIVVPEIAVRREGAPEIQEAIAALDAGLCVVIFPEGYLRRKEDQILRRFGQGVWQILCARPSTPVMPVWIEGMWGSFTSYFQGPPTKNKRFDFFRLIQIAFSIPEVVPAEQLSDHLATRVYLMNKVLQTRLLLNLPPVPPVELEGLDAGSSTDSEKSSEPEANQS